MYMSRSVYIFSYFLTTTAWEMSFDQKKLVFQVSDSKVPDDFLRDLSEALCFLYSYYYSNLPSINLK